MASFRLLTSSLRPLMVLSAASPANLRLSLVQSARTLWSQSEFGSVLLRSSLNGSLEFRRHYQDKVTLKSKSFTEGGSSNRLYYLDLIEKYEGSHFLGIILSRQEGVMNGNFDCFVQDSLLRLH